jgi:2-oxoglutarate ferredoxin oxidoreductase subunit gamma
MEFRAIFAGFGGQGVVSMGILLAHAAMDYGRHVTFYPAYGPAMRGGTANCSIIISEEPIASPIVSSPTLLAVMNEPSLDAYGACVEPRGFLLVNSSLISKKAARDDVSVYAVPANEIAENLGQVRMANMAMLGGVLAASNVLPVEHVQAAIVKFVDKLQKNVKPNQEAMQLGYEFVAKQRI